MGRDDKEEVKEWKGRGKDLPDQCQTASYAPEQWRELVALVPMVESSWTMKTGIVHGGT